MSNDGTNSKNKVNFWYPYHSIISSVDFFKVFPRTKFLIKFFHYFRVLCNPWVFAHAHALFSRTKNEGSNSEYQEILASFMDYLSLCDEGTINTVFLKLPIFCMPQGIIINKIFPTINHICIAGHPQSSIESLFKVRLHGLK